MNPLDLVKGEIYYDIRHKEEVEFQYMGQTGLAIVCEPGDSGGGMQSCWGITADNLQSLTNRRDEDGPISFEQHRAQTVKDLEQVISILNNLVAKVKIGNMHAYEDFWALEEDEGQTILSIREIMALRYIARQERIKD